MSLSDITAPARYRVGELEAEVVRLLNAFNVYTGDQSKVSGIICEYADSLEEFPLYAVRKAIKWAKNSSDKLPTIKALREDAKLAVGSNVLPRKQLLERLLRS